LIDLVFIQNSFFMVSHLVLDVELLDFYLEMNLEVW